LKAIRLAHFSKIQQIVPTNGYTIEVRVTRDAALSSALVREVGHERRSFGLTMLARPCDQR